MPASWSLYLTALAGFLATYLLHSTLLLAASWLVVRSCRLRSRALVERLWKAAAVGGLCTALAQATLQPAWPVARLSLGWPAAEPLQPHGRATGASGRSAAERAETDGANRPVPLPAADLAATVRQSAAAPPGSDRLTAHWPAAATGRGDWSDRPEAGPKAGPDRARPPQPTYWLTRRPAASRASPGPNLSANLAAWLAGLLALFCLTGAVVVAARSWAFRRLVRGCEVVRSGPARRLLDQLLEQASIGRPVTLLRSRQWPQPAAFGVLRWRVVMPTELEGRLSRPELAALLAHELAHLVRGDGLWLWIGRLLCGCFAFQPLNFLARRRWQRCAEFLCDDWAVRWLPSPLVLARCLAAVAEWRVQHGRGRSGLTWASAGGGSALAQRIRRLVHGCRRAEGDEPERWRWAFPAAAVLVALLLACCGPLATVDRPAGADQPLGWAAPGPDSAAASPAPSALSPPTDAVPPSDSAATDPAYPVHADLARLRAELLMLERDADELKRSLADPNVPTAVRRLATQLDHRIERLRQQRKLLETIADYILN